jgi:predicted metal-dependent phosphoesterase TrpH
MTTLRADLHVHTCHSTHNDNIAFLGARDCHSRPEDVYAVAEARGMDLVAIIDHDPIDDGPEPLVAEVEA